MTDPVILRRQEIALTFVSATFHKDRPLTPFRLRCLNHVAQRALIVPGAA